MIMITQVGNGRRAIANLNVLTVGSRLQQMHDCGDLRGMDVTLFAKLGDWERWQDGIKRATDGK